MAACLEAPGLGIARAIARELFQYRYLSMQSVLLLRVLTPSEMRTFRKHFYACGYNLTRGKFDQAVEYLAAELARCLAPVLAGLGLVSETKVLLASTARHDADPILILASEFGHLELVRLLLTPTWDISYGLKTALEKAARKGHLSIVQCLCRHADARRHLEVGLCGAARGGRQEVVFFLVKRGAKNFTKALRAAALKGHLQLVQYFLKRGAKVESEALCMAAIGGNPEVVSLLLKVVDTRSSSKSLAGAACYSVSPAALMPFLEAGVTNYIDIARKGLERGNIDTAQFVSCYVAPTLYEELASFAAFYNGTGRYIEQLMFKVPISADKILTAAVAGLRVDNVQLALGRGASNLNAALVKLFRQQYTIGSKGRRILELLVEAGATNLNSALVEAATNGHYKAVLYLVAQGANAFDEALMGAVHGRKPKLTSLLLDLGATAYNEALREVIEYDNLPADFVGLLQVKGLVSADLRELEPDLVNALTERGLLN